MRIVIFSFLILGSVVAQDRERRLVNTTQGPVYGYKDQEFDIFVFYEIPYATAPTGPHRFKVQKHFYSFFIKAIVLMIKNTVN